MKKLEKRWSIAAAVNFLLALWFAFSTAHCARAVRKSQQAEPPPPPDDYLTALVLMSLAGLTLFFGFLFAASLIVLVVLFIKNKYFGANAQTKLD